MNSCTTCSPAGRQQEDEQKKSITLQAVDHAKKEQIPVAVYQEGGEWKFANAFFVYSNGLAGPSTFVVSVNYNTTPEPLY